MSVRAETATQSVSARSKDRHVGDRERPLPPDLRAVRHERGFTLAKVSDLTGLHPGRISELERGERAPKTSELAKLARAYGVGGWRVVVLTVVDESETP